MPDLNGNHVLRLTADEVQRLLELAVEHLGKVQSGELSGFPWGKETEVSDMSELISKLELA